ncbi:MAG: hypothetical protein LBO66_10030 [Deltaproteobacteria bacterium]|nr:hypothetical protein [Deltaproteobacteria bacterium]
MGASADLSRMGESAPQEARAGVGWAQSELASLSRAGRGFFPDGAPGLGLLGMATEAGRGFAADATVALRSDILLGGRENPAKLKEWRAESAASDTSAATQSLVATRAEGLGARADPAVAPAARGSLERRDPWRAAFKARLEFS